LASSPLHVRQVLWHSFKVGYYLYYFRIICKLVYHNNHSYIDINYQLQFFVSDQHQDTLNNPFKFPMSKFRRSNGILRLFRIDLSTLTINNRIIVESRRANTFRLLLFPHHSKNIWASETFFACPSETCQAWMMAD
jgi:hypothetical protein